MNNKVIQPMRTFKSSVKKIVLQVGIVFVYVLFFGYCGMKIENILERLIYFMFLLILAVFILWRQRLVRVELCADRMRYRSFLGKEQEVFYSQMKSVDFGTKMYIIFTICPVYGYTRYFIYTEKEDGKKRKFNMNSLSHGDFSTILKTFLVYGETEREIAMCESLENPYFSKKFSVPVENLRDTYFYFGKKIGNPLLKISLVGSFIISVLESAFKIPVFERLGGNILLEIFYISMIMIPLFYFLIWLVEYRPLIKKSKMVPKDVFVCQEYLEIDDRKFAFEKITEGYVVSSKFHCERVIEFKYEGKEFTFRFGQYRNFLPDCFSEYALLEAYLRGKGFERWIQ